MLNGGGISKDQIENIEILFIPTEINAGSSVFDLPVKSFNEYENLGYHIEFKLQIDNTEYFLGDTSNIYENAAFTLTNEKYELPELSPELFLGKTVKLKEYVTTPEGGQRIASVGAKIAQLYITDGGEIGATSYNITALNNEYNYYINGVEANSMPLFYLIGDFLNRICSIDDINKALVIELKNNKECLTVYWYQMSNNTKYTMKILTFSYSFTYGDYIWISDPA